MLFARLMDGIIAVKIPVVSSDVTIFLGKVVIPFIVLSFFRSVPFSPHKDQ